MATKEDLRVVREDMATTGELSAFRESTTNDFRAVHGDAADLRNDVRGLVQGLGAVRAELGAFHSDVAGARANVAAHRQETAKGFAELDKELARHSDVVHRKLEDDIAALKTQVTTKKAARPVPRRPRRG